MRVFIWIFVTDSAVGPFTITANVFGFFRLLWKSVSRRTFHLVRNRSYRPLLPGSRDWRWKIFHVLVGLCRVTPTFGVLLRYASSRQLTLMPGNRITSRSSVRKNLPERSAYTQWHYAQNLPPDTFPPESVGKFSPNGRPLYRVRVNVMIVDSPSFPPCIGPLRNSYADNNTMIYYAGLCRDKTFSARPSYVGGHARRAERS